MLDIQTLTTCCHTNLSLKIASGEAVSLSGPSGCGKSVLLRALCDLDPHEGSITLDGRLQQDMPAPEWRKRVALLPSEYFFWAETAGDCFEAQESSDEFIDRLNELKLDTSILARPVNQLSAGEKQRLAFLRLMMNQPRCLLLDEACSHLDEETTLAVERIIFNYQQQTGAIVLWVSHDSRQRERVASRQLTLTTDGLTEITS